MPHCVNTLRVGFYVRTVMCFGTRSVWFSFSVFNILYCVNLELCSYFNAAFKKLTCWVRSWL